MQVQEIILDGLFLADRYALEAHRVLAIEVRARAHVLGLVPELASIAPRVIYLIFGPFLLTPMMALAWRSRRYLADDLLPLPSLDTGPPGERR